MSRPLISVLMITYNHEQFISQAITSILAQKGDFDLELVIGNDCSTDHSNEICESFSQKDKRIKYYHHKTNIGANKNFKFCFDKCSGTYIALCEGDDYWIDDYKLSRQQSFLSGNPEFSTCFHDVYELIDNELKPNSIKYTKDVYSINDLALENFMHTPSIMFKNRGKNFLPGYFEDLYVGDYVVHVYNATFGKIKYIDEKMAVYRIHKNSSWSSKGDIFIYQNISQYLEYLTKGNFDNRIKRIFRMRLLGAYQNLYKLTGDKTYLKKLFKLDGITGLKFLIQNFKF